MLMYIMYMYRVYEVYSVIEVCHTFQYVYMHVVVPFGLNFIFFYFNLIVIHIVPKNKRK